MRDGFRPATVATEALKNLGASLPLAAVSIFAAFTVGFGVPAATLVDVAAIRSDEQAEVASGSNVLRITAVSSSSLPAARCEELNGVPAVLAAGGLKARSTVSPVARPGDAVILVTGTPSLARILWPDEEDGAGTASVVVGDEVGELFGLGAGSRFAYSTRADPNITVVSIDRVDQSAARDAKLSSSVFIANAPLGEVNECLVEAKAGARDSVASLASGWFASSGPTAVSPFYLSVTASATPEERLAQRASQHLPPIVAVVLGIAGVAGWFTRRAELSLYRMLGLKRAGILLMLSVEASAIIIAPACLGLTAAMPLMLSPSGIEIALAAGDALRTFSGLLPVPLVGLVLTWRAVRSDSLHGR